MLRKLSRFGLIMSVVGLVALVAGLSLRPNVTAARGSEIHIESFAWGMTDANFLRICMGNEGSSRSASPNEGLSFIFIEMKSSFGNVILERSLTVPQGQFRCTDFSYSDLIAAGLVPEPNTRVQFMVNVGLNEATTVGAAQEVTVGSAETITVANGRTEIFKTIQTRQSSVVQDL